MDVDEVFHLLYVVIGGILCMWCLYTVATPGRRQDRTGTIVLLMVYNVCLLIQNVILAFGNVIGRGDGLESMSRVRLGCNAVGPPVFLVTLTLLAEKTRVRWPCVNKNDKDQRALAGQVVVGFSACVAMAIGIYAFYRDMVVNLSAHDTNGGALIYAPKHEDFGFSPEDIQEWLPSLVLLIWSLPLALFIQRKGGLRWYKNRYYGFLPLLEILLFLSRLAPDSVNTQLSSLLDLMLLCAFILCEHKLVGEYREIKDLKKMVERVQEDSGVSAALDRKYPPDEKVQAMHRTRSRLEMRNQNKGARLLEMITTSFKGASEMERTESAQSLHACVIRLKDENHSLRKLLKVNNISMKTLHDAAPMTEVLLTPKDEREAANLGAGVGPLVSPGVMSQSLSATEVALDIAEPDDREMKTTVHTEANDK